MPRKGWKSVSIPEELVEEIDREIEKNPYYWKSRSDVVTHAVRMLLEMRRFLFPKNRSEQTNN
ncbi:MAG: ribbon-helix-helix domain-containing protein [Thermofilaceae archaeon]